MQNSKKSSVTSSSTSDHRSSASNSQKKSSEKPILSEYDYMGRSVTREQPNSQKSSAVVTPLNTNKYHQEIYEENLMSSDEDIDGLTKPVRIIKINDRHVREIYRLPTPPPETKRVFHRAPSPEPKIIERVFVRRPAPEIIENIIEVPPEKVHIINREKYLNKSKSIVRTKVIYLKPHHHHHHHHQYQTEQQQQTYIPIEEYSQQQQQQIILPNPVQLNTHPISIIQSVIPSQTVFHSQPLSNLQMASGACYTYDLHQYH